MATTNQMTFSLDFRNQDTGEIKNLIFGGVSYDKALFNEPKDVAINHCLKLADYDDFKNLVPIFKSFAVLNDTIPSDLSW